ncbi:DUF4247 domain-containing protein [Virgibacillus halodenitrificans]|uniref:DUF4247 domain-containing protein n=1 Tax=Virgibacillus halodenitrificans TaxID=1482 RepID=UPI000EF4C662|nr:DUF4247 domain-containing protein [Virgibacillus halodenitrificans]
MNKRWLMLGFFSLLILLLTACSDRGMNEEISITSEELPDEPEKNELISSIKADGSYEIDDLIEAHFPLIDVVNGDTYDAEVFATKRFNREEIVSLLASVIEPREISEEKDQQQIMVYEDDFVTVKPSEDDSSVMVIEVASKEFVRNNYSPSFLSTYFTYRLLDSMLGNNWSDRRSRECQNGGCYGGYSGGAYGAPKRGNTSYRGGGPGSGK